MLDPETLEAIQTPQEIVLYGSTPDDEDSLEKEEWREKWYIPQGVRKNEISLEEAIKLRKEAGHFETGMLNMSLRVSGEKPLSIKFSEIDEKTGMTKEDPILGFWDEDKKEVVGVEGRDLTQDAYKIFKELEVDLHLRRLGNKIEGENPSSEHKG